MAYEKFEYTELDMPVTQYTRNPDIKEIVKQLNEMGEQRWDLAAMLTDQRTIIYKREKPIQQKDF